MTETRTLIFDRTLTLEQSVKLVKDHVDRKEAQETFDLQKIENRLNLLDGIKQSLGGFQNRATVSHKLTNQASMRVYLPGICLKTYARK